MYKVMLANNFYFTRPDFGNSDSEPGSTKRSAAFIASLADRLKNLSAEHGPVIVLTDLADVFHICFAEAALRAREAGADVRLHIYKTYLTVIPFPAGYIYAASKLEQKADSVCSHNTSCYNIAESRKMLRAEADLIIELNDPAPSCNVVKFTLSELATPPKRIGPSAYLAVVKSQSGASTCYAVVFSDHRTLTGSFTFHGDIKASEDILLKSLLNPELDPSLSASVVYRGSEKQSSLPCPELMKQAFSLAKTQALFAV